MPSLPSALRLTSALPLLAALFLPAMAGAEAKRAHITPEMIEAATYAGQGDLPPGQSALTAKVQILLDRSGVSPGVVDGFRGGMSESAIKAFERMKGLPQDGRMDPQVWALLEPLAASPLTSTYVVTDKDAEGLVDKIPTDYAEKAQMEALGYTSITEKLAERFHMDDRFLTQLNPGIRIEPGATINVTVPAKPIRAKVARILIDKETGRVAAYDAGGRMVADYPATVGSDATPSPHGSHMVRTVALNPNYTYNPRINFKQGNNDKVLTIPPGPNGPVGNVWIGLSQPTYGIHGTPTPSRLFVNQSNGCVRLTNWDARELAGMVQPGQTVVEFLNPGTSIADVTAPVAPPAAAEILPTALATSARPVWRGPGIAQAAAVAGAAVTAGVTADGGLAGAAALPGDGTAVPMATTGAAETGATTEDQATAAEAAAVAAAVDAARAAVGEATGAAGSSGAESGGVEGPGGLASDASAAATPVPGHDPLASALSAASDGALPTQPYVLPAISAGAPPRRQGR